ncbi:MAG: single-stranded-DNA-specific exonuclease RecJ [Planctomycetota bacterium]|jgi:single-stranded-DNA-specific exonuclease
MPQRARKHGRWRWEIRPTFEGADDFARQAGTAPLVAQVLANRGITDADTAKQFLSPKLADLLDPADLPGAAAAARRIAAAVAAGEKIVIYGDYDVDGMTAIAIVHACLTLAGADVDFYVPHRLEEGYGLNADAVAKVIAEGAKLIITVDCGISAVEPVAAAMAAGVEVIVTDHHTLADDLPAATTIVHPAVGDAPYAGGQLAGAGVAFKLAWQVARELCGETRVDEPMRKFLIDATALAALGTIADVVPLVGENRTIAAGGLAALPHTNHAGLRALIDSANLNEKKLDAVHVGFVLAPRLNAAGRMGHAQEAVELLAGIAADKSPQIAKDLAAKNTQRQQVEREIRDAAIAMVESRNLAADDRRAIVLADSDWHSGVIGIVASRLVDRFARPAILIAVNGDGVGQASGRSVAGFHMRDALAACSQHLIGFGGHAMAGGFRIDPANIDAFSEAFVAYANANLPAEQLTPSLDIDAETTIAALSFPVVDHLTRLAPFGQGNPQPLVALKACRIISPPRRMGKNGKTVGLILGHNDTTIRAVGFSMGDLADDLVGVNEVDVAATPVLNTFQGRTNVELKLKDVRWE